MSRFLEGESTQFHLSGSLPNQIDIEASAHADKKRIRIDDLPRMRNLLLLKSLRMRFIDIDRNPVPHV